MPSTTSNYGLKKPYFTDNADISVLNENMDVLDGELTPTVVQTTAPPTTNLKGKISVILGWLANRVRAITGKTNWFDTPSVTLEDCKNHMTNGTHHNATTSQSGFLSVIDKQKLDNSTADYTANRLIMRDSYGRARVQNPADSFDIANKAYVDSNFVNRFTASSMSAILTAQSNTSYTTRQVRNIVLWTSGTIPPATNKGEILIKTF